MHCIRIGEDNSEEEGESVVSFGRMMEKERSVNGDVFVVVVVGVVVMTMVMANVVVVNRNDGEVMRMMMRMMTKMAVENWNDGTEVFLDNECL